jgi:hypothetical protein
MKRTFTSVEWQCQLDELTLAAQKRYPHYGFDHNGAPVFYEYCREAARLARLDGEYEVSYELEALPYRHAKEFGREEVK